MAPGSETACPEDDVEGDGAGFLEARRIEFGVAHLELIYLEGRTRSQIRAQKASPCFCGRRPPLSPRRKPL
jgi:hypothetical protein